MSEMKSKRCSKCLIEKELGEFQKDKSKKDGLYSSCRSCGQIKWHKRYLSHRNILILKSKEYNSRPEIKERKKQYIREYYIKNKEDILSKVKEYSAKSENKIKRNSYIKQRHSIPQNKIIQNLRNAIRRGFKGLSKLKHTKEYLGGPFEFFQDYILSKCPPEFTMDNFGSVWCIDHIVPVSRFDFTDPRQVAKCCHYSNFQPLSTEDNAQKGDSFELVRRNMFVLDFNEI